MRIRIAAAILGLAALASPAQEKRRITVEWTFSDAAEELTALPASAWTLGNQILLLDSRRPEAERTLERLDAETGARTQAVDQAKALSSLASVLGAADTPKMITWPTSLDSEGSRGAYLFGGDVFILDIAASRFDRITSTPEPETIVRLSPDGRRVAYVRSHDLYMTDLGTRAEVRLTTDGSANVLNGSLSWLYWEEIFDHAEEGYWWSGDSTSIAFLRTDESAVSEMTWLDFKQPVPAVIRQRYPKAGGTNPSVQLGIVDARSGRTVWLDRNRSPYEYILRVAWLPDSAHVAVQVTNRAQTRLDLLFVDQETGAAKHVLSDPDKAWVTIHGLQFVKDGRFVWTSERDGYTHLYLYKADGTLIGRITSGKWSVRGPQAFYSAPLGATFVDDVGGWVYFTALEKSPVERHVYRAHLDGSGFQRVSREDGTHRPVFSPDRRFFLDAHSSHNTLPSLSLRTSDGSIKTVVAPPRNDLLATLDIQAPEITTIPAADGFPLPARLLKPKGFDTSHRYPVIVNPYGGPSAPTVSDSFSGDSGLFDQVLIDAGYLVVNVDNRSATGIAKMLEDPVAGKVWSDYELADLVAAVRWLKAQSWVDPGRVGIWGWSGGGTFTLLAMTRSAEFKAGIAVAPLVDGRFYDTKFEETYMKMPADNPVGYEHIALQRYAKDLHGRLLLVYGTYDDNVHPQNELSFANELIKTGTLFDMMVYPMRQHGIADTPARVHLFTTMLEFWKRYL